MKSFVLAGALALALSLPVAAQDCFTVDYALKRMTENGYVNPHVGTLGDDVVIYFGETEDRWFAAPVDENQCVNPNGILGPGYKPAIGA